MLLPGIGSKSRILSGWERGTPDTFRVRTREKSVLRLFFLHMPKRRSVAGVTVVMSGRSREDSTRRKSGTGGQVQEYTPAGNNERNQCCTAPLRRQSNGRRVRATTPLAPIAFCRPLVSATATTVAGGGKRQREGGGRGHDQEVQG